MKIVFIPFIFSLMIYCSSDSLKTRYYKDVDLFKLKEINELPSSTKDYPFVKMNFIGKKEIEITWFSNKDVFLKENYKNKNGFWQCIIKNSFPSEGFNYKTYRFIKSDSVIDVVYKSETYGIQNLFNKLFNSSKTWDSNGIIIDESRYCFSRSLPSSIWVLLFGGVFSEIAPSCP